MKDKGSVWMDCHKEADEIVKLMMAHKISLQEASRRLSTINKLIKAANKSARNIFQDPGPDLADLDIEELQEKPA